jgi:choline dehydrogenase
MFQTKTKLTGHIPFAALATAQDIFGAHTESIKAATKENLASWSKVIAERLNGGVSPSQLERKFQLQHDVIFNKKASMAEFEFFSVGDITGVVFSPTLPFSWGSMHLNPAGEIDNPTVDPNFLSVDFDMQTAREIGRIARKMWSTKPLSDLAGDFVAPGDAVLPENATDAQWTEFLTSTCKWKSNYSQHA